MCIDTAHLWGSGLSIEQAMPLLKQHKDYISLIHLNGNCLTKGVGNDKHAPLCDKSDNVWTDELLVMFLRVFKGAVCILER